MKSEKSINEGYCPDCGNTTFLEGPHGGEAVNIRCKFCGSEFNFVYPFEAQRIDRDMPGLYRKEFELTDIVKEHRAALGATILGKTPATRAYYWWVNFVLVFVLVQYILLTWISIILALHQQWAAFWSIIVYATLFAVLCAYVERRCKSY